MNFWEMCPTEKFVCINNIIWLTEKKNENDNDKVDQINKI